MLKIGFISDNYNEIDIMQSILRNQSYELVIVNKNHDTYKKEFIELINDKEVACIIYDFENSDKVFYEISKEYKKLISIIPLLFCIRTYEDEEIIENGLKLGAFDFITKPIRRNEILIRLKTIISYRKKKNEIERKRKFEELLVSNAHVLIILTDNNFNIELFNQEAETFFKISEEEAKQKDFFKIISNDTYIETLKKTYSLCISNNKKYWSFEKTYKFNKEEFFIEWKTTFIYDENKEIETIINIGYDKTYNQMLERRVDVLAADERLKNIQLEQAKQELEFTYKQIKEKDDKIENELKLARKFQRHLIPNVENINTGQYLNLDFKYIPVDMLGGDFFDIECSLHGIKGMLIDVMGHGISASLITMMAKIIFSSYINETFSVSDFCNLFNKQIYKALGGERYLTGFFFRYSYKLNKLQYVNAGHTPGILYKRKTNEIHYLKNNSMIIGIDNDFNYKNEEISLNVDDKLFLCTDGITELKDKNDILFGKEFIADIIKNNPDKNPTSLIYEILKKIRRKTEKNNYSDDISLILFEVKK